MFVSVNFIYSSNFNLGQACKDGVPQFLVTPDNVHLTSFGRIVLNICTPEKIAETKYWCPEMSDPNFCSNTVNLDKVSIKFYLVYVTNI